MPQLKSKYYNIIKGCTLQTKQTYSIQIILVSCPSVHIAYTYYIIHYFITYYFYLVKLLRVYNVTTY